jgi:hypothetical protein
LRRQGTTPHQCACPDRHHLPELRHRRVRRI